MLYAQAVSGSGIPGLRPAAGALYIASPGGHGGSPGGAQNREHASPDKPAPAGAGWELTQLCFWPRPQGQRPSLEQQVTGSRSGPPCPLLAGVWTMEVTGLHWLLW